MLLNKRQAFNKAAVNFKQMTQYHIITLTLISILALSACQDDEPKPINPILEEEYYAGGETTIFTANAFAFSTPAPNLTDAHLNTHLDGDAEFEISFVSAPADFAYGLGSVYNNKSCIACHPADGRAPRPDNINDFSGFFLRASMPGQDPHGGPMAVPGFGTQIQNQALFGLEPEAEFEVTYIESEVTYPDGEKVYLSKPVYSLKNAYIPLPEGMMLSPRIGPPVFGLGLLEAIPEEAILANADEMDTNGDGISGKANYVWDEELQQMRIGRFGWKANTPSVMIQSAGAYNGDMGVTTPLFPNETCEGQSNCIGDNDEPEIEQQVVDDVVFYLQTLAVPAPRNLEREEVKRGRELFTQIGCASCHIPKMETGAFPDIPELANQTIYPYSDMLLHDMGFGLADDRPDYLANGQEWKTRPLWGIGMTKLVNGHTHFLHDGRARNFEEAILWHGGEAEAITHKFKNLKKEDRSAVIAFLQAL